MFDTQYGKLYHEARNLRKKEWLPWEIYDRYFVKVYGKTRLQKCSSINPFDVIVQVDREDLIFLMVILAQYFVQRNIA